ncbi:hypothetical protein BJ170DRAFT_683828 [Xylariales sp. AK1849]|nr:hypothetical protein BJ170DRAFT_683828 [Xylariales sp. AK1849]
MATTTRSMAAKHAMQKFRDAGTSKEVKFYTSARLLQHLTSGDLVGDTESGCDTHELLYIPEQSGKSSPEVEVYSCICGTCHCHFHITCKDGYNNSCRTTHPEQMHMFALSSRSGKAELRATRVGDHVITERVILACTIEGCLCTMEIEVLPPRLSPREKDNFMDEARVTRHLQEARAQEPARFPEASDNWSQDAIGLFLRYLFDGLAKTSGKSLQIKKHNKKFTVCFSNDFDDLLRTLGFTDQVLDDNDEAWVFPSLEPTSSPSSPTPFASLRAKWEAVEAELMVCNKLKGTQDKTLNNAWDGLKRITSSNYNPDPFSPQLSETDMDLLGCLANYKPTTIVWAATFLAENCPSRHQEFLDAAMRCDLDRDEEAPFQLAMFRSKFDPLDEMAVADAYKYFDAQSNETNVDYFLSKYYTYAQSDTSDEGRARAENYLERIGKHLGTDIVSLIDPAVLVAMGASATPSSGRMNLDQASRLLGDFIDPDSPAYLIQDCVNRLAQDSTTDRSKAAEALNVLAEFKQPREPEEAALLLSMTGIFKAGATNAEPASPPPSFDAYTPPGLRNIGNTCYLNSLLQFFYSVKAVRSLVLDYPQKRLELDQESVGKRRTGNGIPVGLEEAIVARQFIESLKALFLDLQTTTRSATEPSQKLANTALKSASVLLTEKPKTSNAEVMPPPLPARPSPAPPKTFQDEVDMVNVTVEPVDDAMDAASVVSSQTLVNDGEGNSAESYVEVKTASNGRDDLKASIPKETATTTDTEALDTFEDLFSADVSLDEKIRLISDRLEHSDRKGTDQQDVGEIIEFILEHIMRAISPSGRMSHNDELQTDAITETFFPLIVNYTQKADEPVENAREEVIPDSHITAFPHPKAGVAITLYEALDRSHDVQYLKAGNLARYTAIRTLPPNLLVCIQRTGETKNRNPVIIEDVLYMDRYMEAKSNSELRIVRHAVWVMKEYLGELEVRSEEDPKHTIGAQDTSSQESPNYLTHHFTANGDTELTDVNESSIDFATLNGFPHSPKVSSLKRKAGYNTFTNDVKPPPAKKRSSIPDLKKGFVPYVAKILGDTTTSFADKTTIDLKQSKDRVESYYSRLNNHAYRLHAVICHAGGTVAGHYWVWIRDFKKDRWLKFNDSNVTVDNRDPQAVLDDLNQSGDPYYLAYVRDDEKDLLVDIPQRAMPDPNTSGVELHGNGGQLQTIEGIAPDKDHGLPGPVAADDFHAVTRDGDITEAKKHRSSC